MTARPFRAPTSRALSKAHQNVALRIADWSGIRRHHGEITVYISASNRDPTPLRPKALKLLGKPQVSRDPDRRRSGPRQSGRFIS